MSNDKKTCLDNLESLRKDFISHFPGRLQGMENSWDKYDSTDDPLEALQTLLRQSHSLKGSGATFGYTEISRFASQLYTIIAHLLDHQHVPDSLEKEQINVLLKHLNNINLTDKSKFELPNIPDPKTAAETKTDSENLTLLLVMKDKNDANKLIDQLQHYGYDFSILNDIDKLSKTIQETRPFSIIIDIEYQQQTGNMIEAETETKIPIIALSNKDDIDTRLQAVRSGCVSFLTQPVHAPELIDTLDKINQKRFEEPNRILIVEDSKSLALFYQVTLEGMGMETRIVSDPLQVLDSLSEFNAELILMDMYMPGCDGQEMAAVIRQHEAYVSVPIVFLSSEQDTSKQLLAMSHGGDDFLTKPINPNHLIQSVETRTSRYRQLRSYMVRDSLTGLYNHSKTKDMLEQDLYRCARNDTNLVFAMIDIDKFKTVNDTYGHPIGDKVIKSLSRLLTQRLRKTDTVGRYGGEEFAIILYDTDIKNAMAVINKIREHFSMVSHFSGDTEFNVTFSCGLAAYPYFDTVAELNEAADKALYQAKNAGRNCVMAADLTLI